MVKGKEDEMNQTVFSYTMNILMLGRFLTTDMIFMVFQLLQHMIKSD